MEASVLSLGVSVSTKGVYISGRERKSGPMRVGGVAGGWDDVSDSPSSEESVSSGVRYPDLDPPDEYSVCQHESWLSCDIAMGTLSDQWADTVVDK